ncbi:hypothetical protein [Nocardioides coralli]|uniref:hypothetical protein n=1 Tax=Nocardioides coralli TaxID=2872154 RepID=UPI001CA3E1D3|nr:hypothetical protein [Nocardioides coralli]QZY30426.1 hypothetical protein K6T13_07165 [Nocardioides coralli]
MRTRVAVGAVGALAAAYGALLLLDDPLPALVSLVVWLAGGVLLHDAVLAPAALGLGWLGSRFVPEVARGPAVVGGVVLGSVTLLAIPVLGRFGASPGNDTLLDRNYVAGWLLLAGLTALGVAAATLVRSMRRRRGVRAGG